MSLAEYLAKNYLSAETPDRPKKKRKKTKHAAAEDGLIINDDPPDLRDHRTESDSYGRDDDDNSPVIAGMRPATAGFKKSKSSWKTVDVPAPSTKSATNIDTNINSTDQATADAVLASAAAERAAHAQETESAPVITDDEAPRMESGARGGLQTAAETAALVAEQQRQRDADAATVTRKKKKKQKDHGDDAPPGGETIYRDASGRIINVAMRRAEARAAAEAAAAEERAQRDAATGPAQLRAREDRARQLEEARTMPLSRGADDPELNAELRAVQRWDDPAVQFLPPERRGAGVAGEKKVYQGSWAPNRYGIRPGYRWDGVDRSNGFENKWFAARNRKERNRNLEYEWQMDE